MPALSCALLLVLAGCTHYSPVVLPTLKCQPAPALLQSCAAPTMLADGLTFADMVRGYQADRQSLLLCSARQDDLRAAIQACSQQIEQYNDALGKLSPNPPGK